jgi:hypothetical protein
MHLVLILREGDQEVVKRSGRDEPVWVAIHQCKGAMLGISLCSYLDLKLAEMDLGSNAKGLFPSTWCY